LPLWHARRKGRKRSPILSVERARNKGRRAPRP
jgi:hypothetical protein